MAVIEPRKNTVGTAKACTASQRNVKIGYVLIDIIKNELNRTCARTRQGVIPYNAKDVKTWKLTD